MKFKDLLLNEEYNFLRENEHLGDNIILLGLGGSHAYGTNIEGSDIDIRALFVCEYYLTGDRFWLHTSREWITKMRNQMAVPYNNLFRLDKWSVEKGDFI